MFKSSTSTSAAITIAVTAATTVTFLVVSNYCRRHLKDRRLVQEYETRITKLNETRRAERTGRIRAEMRLRTLLKKSIGNDGNDDETVVLQGGEELDHDDGDARRRPLVLHRIGTIRSPYTKRMGTPRQGALVPRGRGYVQLEVPFECVVGLENYSHAWIVFSFHANTDAPAFIKNTSIGVDEVGRTKHPNSHGNGAWTSLSKTKIRPPRGGGIKVGMLATRSPHRPNNVGLSLVRISNLDEKNKRLHVTALDLVDGTPVFDIKPCVPWDVPGHYDGMPLSVPQWVSCDDELESVVFDPVSLESLARCVRHGRLDPFYTNDNDGVEGATETIRQVLAQDPRASNSNRSNKRGSSHSGDNYRMLFCSVEVEFSIKKVSDRDGVVTVINVHDDLDLSEVERVDGIPILLKIV